ncbi:YcnI family protein [Cryobacterium mannosilyticum]|uniref:DUF1775 domain-containing protein n=1 Tax=Cryobacterium mannosilyticum TaxID=1259190 RepID=A0A4R8W8R3_9MICO|nr:YcnI family protein [Cryobacterium mannosilyticum]TFC03086.1 DUF1775 domain-containing protein [Cryobacterium mannosilyticum]
MKFQKTALAASALAAGTFLALVAPLAASAHIDIDPSSTAAGSHAVLSFALPHGCDGSPTTSISISIPESVVSVTPTVNPGWTVAKTSVDLAKPITDAEGNTISTRIGRVVYTAITPMEDGLRTTFDLSVPLPADAAGQTLEFPVLQTCATGSTAWDQHAVEGEAEPEHPAPSVAVTAAVAGGEQGHAAGATDAEATSAAAPGDDVLARVLGVGGLVVGAIGIVLAVTGRRTKRSV